MNDQSSPQTPGAPTSGARAAKYALSRARGKARPDANGERADGAQPEGRDQETGGRDQQPEGDSRRRTAPPEIDLAPGLLPFRATPPGPCPYLEDRIERKLWTELGPRDTRLASVLSRAGFRRSHRIAYRPACPGCAACVPVRIRVADFRWSKGLRRVWKRNQDLAPLETEPRATLEQYELFARYLDSRHYDGEMAGMSYLDYRWMVEECPDNTSLVEFRQKESGQLLAVCLIDRFDDGLSAVYSFFDTTQPARSFGTQVVLSLVEAAEQVGLPYVYLGYWIDGSQKMAYKARFQPLEGLVAGQWRLVGERKSGGSAFGSRQG